MFTKPNSKNTPNEKLGLCDHNVHYINLFLTIIILVGATVTA